jgi:plasmid stabilization system protein ParE
MKIEWTEPAITDLEAIRDYIATDSEHYAIQFTGRILEAVEKLTDFPERGRRFRSLLKPKEFGSCCFRATGSSIGWPPGGFRSLPSSMARGILAR